MTPNVARPPSKALTIGMVTYDDYDGVNFSVMALRLFHPEVAADIEILIVDNHPEGMWSACLQELATSVPNCRYMPFNRTRGAAVRDVVIREANAEFVLCMDCHVMFAPGALHELLNYFYDHPDTPDLLQGPLVGDDLRSFSSHLDAAAPPFEIGMQDMGVFACRKSAWVGINPRLRGFGGEEGYIQEKFRRAGARALCLPFLRWTYRPAHRTAVPDEQTWEDRIRNYLIIADELGMDPSPALDHYRAHLGHEVAERIIGGVRNELSNPFHFFDAIYCINLAEETGRWQRVSARFAQLGILDRVRRFDAIRSDPHHIGCGLSHRAIVEEAKRQHLANVLVFEDDVVFTSDAIPGLAAALADLRSRKWRLLYLGGCTWQREQTPVEGALRLARAGVVTCTHAIAYCQTAFDRILDQVPADFAGMEAWLETQRGIDQYFAYRYFKGKYILSPVIASQPPIVRLESLEVQQRLLV